MSRSRRLISQWKQQAIHGIAVVLQFIFVVLVICVSVTNSNLFRDQSREYFEEVYTTLKFKLSDKWKKIAPTEEMKCQSMARLRKEMKVTKNNVTCYGTMFRL